MKKFRRVLIGAFTAVALGVVPSGIVFAQLAASAPSAINLEGFGPAPRDAEGRFQNLAGELSHGGLFSVRVPFFFRRVTAGFRDFAGAPAVVPNDGRALRENVNAGARPTVTWVGHATLLVQMGGLSFLTDPTWSNTASPVSFAGPKRFVTPGIEIADLPPIDFVVISHNHYDHLDIGTLKTLAERSPATRFFVGLGNDELLRNHGIENVTAFDWGQSTTVGPLRIYCLPSQHWSKRTLNDTRQTLWAAWAVQSANRKFYFGGDTGYFMGFARIGERFGHFDLAAVPIGAYQPVAMMRASHLNPEEAVVAATDLRARTMIAMHFGTFDLSDEPLDEPPTRFLNAARKSGVPADRAWVFKIGETRDF